MRRSLFPFFLLMIFLAATACTPQLKYYAYHRGADVPVGGLKISLQSSIVTFSNSRVNAAASKANASGALEDNCRAVGAKNWWNCFDYVKPQIAVTSATSDASIPRSPTKPTYNSTYIVVPSGGALPQWIPGWTTTKLTASPIAGSDGLYKQITVGYTSNAAAIITSAGMGAVSGFGIAGPWGAAAGFAVGALAPKNVGAGAAPPPVPHERKAVTVDLDPVLCPDARRMLRIPIDLKPVLFLPFAIDTERAKPFGNEEAIENGVSTSEEFTKADACWRWVPNNAALGITEPVPDTAPVVQVVEDPRLAIPGDGWLYRIVSNNAGEFPPVKFPPAGAMTIAEYFQGAATDTGNAPWLQNVRNVGTQESIKNTLPITRSDFPVSACRNVTVEITWWKELVNESKALSTGARVKSQPSDKADNWLFLPGGRQAYVLDYARNPHAFVTKVLRFEAKIADPDYVTVVKLPEGGVINFQPDCGAFFALTGGITYSDALAAAVTQAENLWKAQQGAAPKPIQQSKPQPVK